MTFYWFKWREQPVPISVAFALPILGASEERTGLKAFAFSPSSAVLFSQYSIWESTASFLLLPIIPWIPFCAYFYAGYAVLRILHRPDGMLFCAYFFHAGLYSAHTFSVGEYIRRWNGVTAEFPYPCTASGFYSDGK